jgi:hypothetical protein
MPVTFLGSDDYKAFVNSEFTKNEKLLRGAGFQKK